MGLRSKIDANKVVASLGKYNFDKLDYRDGADVQRILSTFVAQNGAYINFENQKYPDALGIADVRKWLYNFRTLSSGSNGVTTEAEVIPENTNSTLRNFLIAKTTTVCRDRYTHETCTDSLAYEYLAMMAAAEVRRRGYPYIPLPFALAYDNVRVQIEERPRRDGMGTERVWVTNEMFDEHTPNRRPAAMLFMERFSGGITYSARLQAAMAYGSVEFELFVLLDIMQFCAMSEACIYACGFTHYDAHPGNVMIRPLRSDRKVVMQVVRVGDTTFRFPSNGLMTFIDLGRAHVNGIATIGKKLGYKRGVYDGSIPGLEEYGVRPNYAHPMFDTLFFVTRVLQGIDQASRMTPRLQMLASQFLANYPTHLSVFGGMYNRLSYQEMVRNRERIGAVYWTRPAHLYNYILGLPGFRELVSQVNVHGTIEIGSGTTFPAAHNRLHPE